MNQRESKLEKVRELHEKGRSPREIALLLGITTQAVYLHMKSIRNEKTPGVGAPGAERASGGSPDHLNASA